MLLTQRQKDALIQFSQMGLEDSEKNLSELVNTPINIQISEIVFYPLSYLNKEFASLLHNDFIRVDQNIKGGLSGNGLLVFEYSTAVDLVNLLQNDPNYSIQQLNVSAEEILKEVGNILVGNYLGMMGSLMENPLLFSLPNFEVISFDKLINQLLVNTHEIRYVLLMSLVFNLRKQTLKGHLMLVSGVMTLSCLIRGIESSQILLNPPVQQMSFNSNLSYV